MMGECTEFGHLRTNGNVFPILLNTGNNFVSCDQVNSPVHISHDAVPVDNKPNKNCKHCTRW